MTIHIDYESDIILEFDYEELIKKCIHETMLYEGCPYEAEISIVITDNASICDVNNEFRNIDKSTDVLSFPMIDFDTPSDFKKLSGLREYFNPESLELMLGDIMVSVEKVISQADEYGHSRERELAFLIVHSMLHLFGYDHIEDNERIKMEKLQENILVNVGLLRDVDEM